MFLHLLMLLFVQAAAPAVASDPNMVIVQPGRKAFERCLRPLAADGSVSSRLTVTCATVRNGVPTECRLETGKDQPVRSRAAARCLAPEHRFTDAAGQPANGGPVTIPISLNVTVR